MLSWLGLAVPCFHLVPAGLMSPTNSQNSRTYITFSNNEQKLKPGLALLFKAKGVDGYDVPVTWANAVDHVRFVQNPGTQSRPVITFPAANAVVKKADLKLNWTMASGSLGPGGTVRCCQTFLA